VFTLVGVELQPATSSTARLSVTNNEYFMGGIFLFGLLFGVI
jgi:hypothetical protein